MEEMRMNVGERSTGIRIVPYDEQWEFEFLLLQQVLSNSLGELVKCFEHVGSTSVKGLAAKPIIDLDLVINANDEFEKVSLKLQDLGYLYEGNLGIEGREAFARKDEFVPWGVDQTHWLEHHLYVCTKDSAELHRHLTFRNYLREHPEVASSYEHLKISLAKKSTSRSEYMEAKGEFIRGILELAN